MPTAPPDMFLRVRQADGRYKPVLLVTMTDAQLAEAEAVLARDEAWIAAGWVVALARWIRDHAPPPPPTEILR